MKDGLIYNCKSKWVLKNTTREVDLLCAIKSGQKGSDMIWNTWHPFKELKELYSLQVAEFAELRGASLSTQFVENQAVIFQ